MDLSGLNAPQREAVTAAESAVLVLAGAGSGKTRVLTTRAAYLTEQGVPPFRMLALTFTNKAAAEMKSRIAALVPDAHDMWVMTFHALCARLLRIEGESLGYSGSFTIYDAGDALTVVREILKQLDVGKEAVEPRTVRSLISRAKNDGVSPAHFKEAYGGSGDAVTYTAMVYGRYEDRLRADNAMDFDDLLLKTLRLFEEYPEVLEKYRRRFRHIMVDEYQDTNSVQYGIVRLLAKGGGNLFVVGDDDQSIYGWRGADISNILDFEKDFPGARVIRLEQNYRSHQGILDAANGVIRRNSGRMGKDLWSSVKSGQKPLEFEAESDFEEAQFVAEKVASLLREGKYAASDIAVLYRVNSQSRVLENKLKERGVPYVIYGGQSFYERKEIKDLLAYLNLLCNPDADLCFMRAVGVPKRGIGDVSLGKLYAAAQGARRSLFDMSGEPEGLPKKAAESLAGLRAVLLGIRREMQTLSVLQAVERVFEASGLRAMMQADASPEGRMRLLNIEEFFRSVADYERDTPAPHTLAGFLERSALISDVDAVGDEDDKIMLLTLHSAKGLEFPVVFIVGMQEGLLPHQISLSDGDVEEERRLCYVGMTRAKKRLYLTWSATRCVRMGAEFQRVACQRSRFMSEIPDGCMEMAGVKRQPAAYFPQAAASQSPYSFATQGRMSMPSSAPPKRAAHAPSAFAAGVVVSHPKFGRGKITATNGEGEEKIAVVRFDAAGEKKMFVAFAPLEILEG